jgi:hypothetical protein
MGHTDLVSCIETRMKAAHDSTACTGLVLILILMLISMSEWCAVLVYSSKEKGFYIVSTVTRRDAGTRWPNVACRHVSALFSRTRRLTLQAAWKWRISTS